MFIYADIVFYVLIGLVLIFGIWAQIKVSLAFNKYKTIEPSSKLSGQDATRHLLESANLTDIKIANINGELTDNYNPKTKVISLSQSTTGNPSVASLGVVAHEIGHAMQDRDGYAPFKLRQAIVPWAKIGSIAFYPLFIIGLVLLFVSSATTIGRVLIYVATGLYFLSTLFYLVTWPVERDASKRALNLLTSSGTLTSEEVVYAKEVLKAAEFTYISALLTSLLYFLRFLYYVLRLTRKD